LQTHMRIVQLKNNSLDVIIGRNAQP
jgi:hypothetical protein